MSWDALLIDGPDCDGPVIADWNFTHNCNAMAAKVLSTTGTELERAWWDGERPGTCWWDLLRDKTGATSLPLLSLLVGGLSEAPAMFREMNPPNGWGDYDSFLATLIEMRDRAAARPDAYWFVSG
jgi:hypothetical protein